MAENKFVGKTFRMERFGEVTTVVVLEQRRDRVKVQEEGRKDCYTMPIARLEKFFQEVPPEAV